MTHTIVQISYITYNKEAYLFLKYSERHISIAAAHATPTPHYFPRRDYRVLPGCCPEANRRGQLPLMYFTYAMVCVTMCHSV